MRSYTEKLYEHGEEQIIDDSTVLTDIMSECIVLCSSVITYAHTNIVVLITCLRSFCDMSTMFVIIVKKT